MGDCVLFPPYNHLTKIESEKLPEMTSSIVVYFFPQTHTTSDLFYQNVEILPRLVHFTLSLDIIFFRSKGYLFKKARSFTQVHKVTKLTSESI